jgi:hypothetical protein
MENQFLSAYSAKLQGVRDGIPIFTQTLLLLNHISLLVYLSSESSSCPARIFLVQHGEYWQF